ncbi:hypothetical protein M9H77_29637 [Catharanthus roseus]|uniref:Uncharacterized protein n=1 Tax=Catharanthus roseus TaxID=4058 RepID=A0ACB9ZV15_CATRO|nr:hypothetical protein M9H77_29637 [Catharanthus roseus]
MENALKSKVREFEDQEKHPKLFTICSTNLAKCWQECTLLPTVGPPLPSTIGFCLEFLGHWQPTADGRFYLTVAGRSLVCFGLTTLLGGIFYKSSIEVIKEEVILRRIGIQFNDKKRIHRKSGEK